MTPSDATPVLAVHGKATDSTAVVFAAVAAVTPHREEEVSHWAGGHYFFSFSDE